MPKNEILGSGSLADLLRAQGVWVNDASEADDAFQGLLLLCWTDHGGDRKWDPAPQVDASLH
jgi:hypothetical protein